MICDSSTKKCWFGIKGCQSKRDCKGQRICIENKCENPGPFCNKNKICDNNFPCLLGTCLQYCSSDLDCKDGKKCHKGLCYKISCLKNWHCPKFFKCYNGFCDPKVNKCNNDFDCPGSLICQDFTCVIGPVCQTSEDCEFGKICYEGSCKKLPLCSSSKDCPLNLKCLKGKCEPEKSCQKQSECPKGYNCQNNKCILIIQPCESCPKPLKVHPNSCPQINIFIFYDFL